MMKFWSSRTSPFARKVRVVICEKSLQDQIEEIFVSTSPVQSNPELIAQNPLGKLPALTLSDEDASIVVDSRVICQYLDGLGSGAVLHPSGNVRHASLVALAEGVIEAAVSMVYEHKTRPPELRSEAWIEGQWLKIENTIGYIDQHYRDILAHFNMATIGLVCALEYLDFRLNDRNWRALSPELATWHEAQAGRESFVTTRPVE